LCRYIAIELIFFYGVPVLLIVGDQDVPCVAPMRAMSEAIPQSKLHVIPRCGHAANLEKPDEFNELLRSFLERHPIGSG